MTQFPFLSNPNLSELVSTYKKFHNLKRVVLLFNDQNSQIAGFNFMNGNIQQLGPITFNWHNINPEVHEIDRRVKIQEPWPDVFKQFKLDLIIKLLSRDERKLYLGVTNKTVRFNDSQLRAVRTLSTIIEQALLNEVLDISLKRSVQQTKKMISEMGALHEISRMFESSKNLDALLRYVLEKCMDLMNAEAASSMMVVDGVDELEFKIVFGPKSEEVKPFRLKIGKGIAGWVAQNNEPVLIADAYQDPRFDPSFDKRSGFRTRSMLCVPLTYKSKPIGVMTILNRRDGHPFTESDKNLLTTFASQAALAMENAKLLWAAIEKERLDKELQVAAEIQQLIIPQSLPKIPGLEISAAYIPCKEVSGDFYDVITINENLYVFVVADVSGKGIPGAMLVSTMQATLKAYFEYSTDLLSIITNLNDRIMKNTTEDRFITFFFGLYNVSESTLTYINAGHNPPLLVKGEQELEYLRTGGIFIGCMPWRYEMAKISLPAGSILAMYTDGLVEAMNEKNKEFGEKRLIRVLIKNRSRSIGKVKEKIIESVHKHLGDNKLEDDFTLLLIKKND